MAVSFCISSHLSTDVLNFIAIFNCGLCGLRSNDKLDQTRTGTIVTSEGSTVCSLLNTIAKNDWNTAFSGKTKKFRIQGIHRLVHADGPGRESRRDSSDGWSSNSWHFFRSVPALLVIIVHYQQDNFSPFATSFSMWKILTWAMCCHLLVLVLSVSLSWRASPERNMVTDEHALQTISGSSLENHAHLSELYIDWFKFLPGHARRMSSEHPNESNQYMSCCCPSILERKPSLLALVA
jgi:hypothetical protein